MTPLQRELCALVLVAIEAFTLLVLVRGWPV